MAEKLVSSSGDISSISGTPETIIPKLSVQGMTLTLGTRVVLNDISFDIRKGEIVGVLGPNGSGKTSLFRCLTGLIRADRGTTWLDGKAVPLRSSSLRMAMGVVFQDASLDGHLRARENLELGGQLFGLSRKEASTRSKDLLHFVDLSERASDLTKTFSGGMRRRLELARALIHKPDILLLDEPTAGLDPIAFERVWQRILALRKAKDLTVLVSTHRAEEAHKCDRLVVLDRGNIVANESPEKLMERVAGDVVSLEVEDANSMVGDIASRMDVVARVKNPTTIELEIEGAYQFIPRLVESFPVATFISLSIRRPTLADAFFHLTGHTLHGENGELG